MAVGFKIRQQRSLVYGVSKVTLPLILVTLVACQVRTDRDQCEDQTLFGLPSENTGLEEEQCTPRCAGCGDARYQWRQYSTEFIDWLNQPVLVNAPERLTSDPYLDSEAPSSSENDQVCVVSFEDDMQGYRLRTEITDNVENETGSFVTHRGPCGLCSSLEDLAVYIANPDLTGPVRACGARGFTDGREAQYDCLRTIGFSEPCADIWLYNILNTRQKCLAPCLEYLEEPHHLPDGSLNPCIQCDEDESGPVFKLVSGRTRRNSGLASALCRPCESIYPLRHEYTFKEATPR